MREQDWFKLSEHLRALAQGKVKPRRPDLNLGICSEISDWMQENTGTDVSGYRIVSVLAIGWKHHSGNACYPVTGDEEFMRDKWNNPMRIKLCEYLSKLTYLLGGGVSGYVYEELLE